MAWRPILFDMEVQRDFFAPGGSCYSRHASNVAARIYELFSWARSFRLPVVSTVLRLRAGQRSPLADVQHCIEGTAGERKMSGTVLRNRINFGVRNITDLPVGVLDSYSQIIFEKRDTDILKHARAERLVTQLPLTLTVLSGAGLSDGIAQAALGLRMRGLPVIVASDAVLDLDNARATMARLRLEAKGVLFAPAAQVVKTGSVRRRRRFRYAETGALAGARRA